MLAAKLNVVKTDDSPINPLLIQFANGDVNKKCCDQLKFTLYKSSNSADIRKKHRRTLMAETKKMKYTGSNFGMASRSSSLCKYLVGVYNKRTETMKVYDTSTFQLRPKTQTDDLDNTDASLNLSFMEKNDRLVEAFGSTKRIRAIKSRQQNIIDSEELGQSVTNAVSHMLSQPNQEVVENNTAEHEMLPKFNKDAQNTGDIYPLSSMLKSNDFDTLLSPAVEFLAEMSQNIETWRKEQKFCQYVLDHLAFLPENEADRKRKVSLLLYFSYLVQFYQLNYKTLQKKDPLPGVPEIIKEKLFSLFALQQEKSRCVPKRLKDKLVFHIIVLALIIDGFTIECTTLCKDLKMALPRFQNYVKGAGCTIESNQGVRKRKLGDDGKASKLAVLKAPLPENFPDHMPKPGRKK